MEQYKAHCGPGAVPDSALYAKGFAEGRYTGSLAELDGDPALRERYLSV